eukprot:4017409-Prorocentrum_lima.AAC.1
MRRTLTHLHVHPDEWLDEVTGRHRPSMVVPSVPPAEPQEEPDGSDVDGVPLEPAVVGDVEEVVAPWRAAADMAADAA